MLTELAIPLFHLSTYGSKLARKFFLHFTQVCNGLNTAARYVLIALSEIFASITGLEYAFTKAPKNMKSLVMGIFLFTSAIASALGEAFTTISLDPYLVWNYGSMGVLAAVGGILFWLSVRKLDAEEDRLNSLSEGHLDEN